MARRSFAVRYSLWSTYAKTCICNGLYLACLSTRILQIFLSW